MSRSLTLELPEDLWHAVQEVALREGRAPEVIALEWLTGQASKHERQSTPQAEAARRRFRGHFGAIKSGNPRSADNEAIDADLALEYASRREANP